MINAAKADEAGSYETKSHETKSHETKSHAETEGKCGTEHSPKAHRETDKAHTETELKLALSPAGEYEIANHPAFHPSGANGPKQVHLTTTYFDTADGRLDRSGLSLRVRDTGNGRIQTVKQRGKPGVAASRGEWEWPIEQSEPDLRRLSALPVEKQLPPSLAGALQPVVVTDVERTVRVLHLPEGVVIEAALDRGTVAAGDRRETIRELELELHRGDPASLYRLALELHASAPLSVVAQSKAERGRRLGDGQAPPSVKAGDIVLHPELSAAQGLSQIVAEGLGHLLANQPAARSGDAEGVHQMRVAIRRLRAALVLFAEHIEPHAYERITAELRRIGQVFGAARDWDVFALELLPHALCAGAAAGWRNLSSGPVEARRGAAHECFEKELEGPPFTALVLGLAAWAAEGRSSAKAFGKGLQAPLEEVAPELLAPLAEKVARRGRHIARRSDPELHALRKSLKKLRYAVEFLASLYPKKEVKAYLHHCKKLQKTLGSINDGVTATHLARELTEAGRVDLVAALAAVAQQSSRQRRASLRDLPDQWADFRREKCFWA